MVINVMNYLTLILLVLALCASFPTNTQATNSLSEKFSKCEKEFWFKNLSHYKQSLKSKCLKEKKHHQNEKRHRQKHTCHNNKSLDKKIILKKWKEFSNCRCESAIQELKDTKETKVLTCYQIAKCNKVSGKFIGQLTVFKKKSDKHDYDVAVEFSNVKLLNNKEGYYRSKKSNQICKDQYTIETYFIKGEISKKESMNKISLNRISPSSIKIIDKDNEKTITLPNGVQVSIPFPKFGLNDDKDNNIEKPPEKNPKDSKDPKKSPEAPPVDPAGPPPPTKPSDNKPEKPPASPGDNTNTPGYNTPGYNTPGDSTNTPDDSTNTPDDTDTSGGNTKNQNSTPADDDSSVNTIAGPTTKSVTSSNQEASVNPQGAPFTGLLVFGVIVSVGAAFVGYNTYERIKWRRHFRRGQAAAAQLNPSLANVPDYNGYGRAY
ncbi:hypothetical protein RhiirC2_732563 [Rhizophagus irregularis]|uniref:Uncharacterized protein n=1 Tax=Rhizophagus irregularis TaxID=588596 RepID=A0A2N1NTN5_9GLOM|nr:hypothetical protein RhiirC2_732563 [Rhizophagus irregularis]